MILSNCLNNNKKLLWDHYSKLGLTEGKWFFKHKVLLSYNEKGGWNVLKLNSIQLFLRELGFYKSTQLETIHHAWADLKLADHPFIDGDLDKKILDLCKRHLLIGLGSADLSDAEIVCFAEGNHTDRVFRYTMALLIEQHYQKDDRVLVEGYEAGRVLTAWQKKLDRSFAKADQIAQGWDIPNREKYDCVIKWEQETVKLSKLSYRVICTNPLLNEIQENTNPFLEIEKAEQQYEKEPSEENLVHLEEVVDRAFKDVKETNSQYKGTPFERIKAWSNDLLKDYKEVARFFDETRDLKDMHRKIQFVIKQKENEQEINPNASKECVQILKPFFVSRTKQLMERSDQAIYKGETSQDVQNMLKTFGSRNISLSHQIALLKQQGIKRIFVQAGILHLLYNKIIPKKEIDVVRNTLQKHKFIIITPKKSFMKQRAAALNPLARRSL